MLNLVHYFCRRPIRPSFCHACFSQLAQVLCWTEVRRDKLTGIVITQFIQGKSTALGDFYAFIEQAAWVDTLENSLGAQVTFGIGRQGVFYSATDFLCRVAVKVSCKGCRVRACICTLPTATIGMPTSRDKICNCLRWFRSPP